MKDPLKIDVVGNRSQGMYIQENRASATYPSIAPPVSSGISSNWRISRALRPSKNSSIGSSTCNVFSESCSKSSNIYIDSSKREPREGLAIGSLGPPCAFYVCGQRASSGERSRRQGERQGRSRTCTVRAHARAESHPLHPFAA